jgi:hypothetical protein
VKAEMRNLHPVDDGIEEVQEARGFEHRRAVLAR